MSIVLIFTVTLSILFYIAYIYCGASDILDGYIARKSKNTSKFGSMLDSIADIIFFAITISKVLPHLKLCNGIIIWIFMIALIKIVNVVCSCIYYKKIVFLHTVANKITGFILFLAPLILLENNYLSLEIIICIIATFSALQEGHYIRTKKYILY